jgi:PIN domain nuclease of toxin-antitoxin system
VRLLLDTHALLWWLGAPEKLGTVAAESLAVGENEIFVSAATIWEISLKHRLGKLPLPADFLPGIDGILRSQRWTPLPISLDHARLAGGLEWDHRDPFDRMLAAQASAEALSLVTRDPVFRHLEAVVTLW